MSPPHVIVIGAGIGGLAAALDLASSGLRVTLFERAEGPGGKMRELAPAGRGIDSGPTVFTMKHVFVDLFREAGMDFDECLPLVEADCLARHSWLDGSRLELFADLDRSVEAIERFAGASDARAYRDFARESQRIFETLDHPFMRREKPGPVGLGLAVGLHRIHRLVQTRPFETLWSALGQRFSDPRLRMLFGRYATYCGSSPMQSPATLMLIAHAERAGVWMVKGGMYRFAEALSDACSDAGVELRYSSAVDEILFHGRTASGVRTADGEALTADAIVFNGDVNALSEGLLGDDSRRAVPDRRKEQRSLSAVTWSIEGRASGFPLHYHSVFFGGNYPDEFAAIFERDAICDEPTIYICAQDRIGDTLPEGEERLFLLVNAPPRGLSDAELERVEKITFSLLERHGLHIEPRSAVRTSPADFGERFPGSHGAIYGWPTHGWSGSFRRGGSRARAGRLYIAGGSVHPGPGVPMVALSGRIAARAVRRDLGISET